MSPYGHFPPYVPVAERRAKAARKIDKLRKAGRDIKPIEIEGRTIARSVWGKAWCDNLESYSDYDNRLPRGRSYARNGSVIDLQIDKGRVDALVNGSSFYTVRIKIDALGAARWQCIQEACSGQISSLVELLSGSLSSSVMEVVSRPGEGLFPSPSEIHLSCSCPDWAEMCKHVAASLYGVGARLDHEPEMLFTLRGVDPAEMIDKAIVTGTAPRKKARGRVLETDNLAAIFGVDIDFDEGALKPAKAKPKPAKAKPKPVNAKSKRVKAKRKPVKAKSKRVKAPK